MSQTLTSREYRLLFLRALTPLHVGAGKGASVHVELPLQRDEFGFPTIWASSLKGALRANFDESQDACMKKIIFGPEPATEEVSEYSSATSFTDAKLLLIPARVLKGVWAYVASPHMLQQLNVFLKVLGRGNIPVTSVSDGKALVSRDDILIKNSKVVVNEVVFEAETNTGLINALKTVLPKDLQSMIESRGVILVSDDVIRTIINKSLIIQYRVRLNTETKTVASRALWSEEYMPSETLMFSLVMCRDFRSKLKCSNEKTVNASEVCERLEKGYTRYRNTIYIGGKETLGRGLVELYFT
jgi:CRISPR-associated protein Cmr4